MPQKVFNSYNSIYIIISKKEEKLCKTQVSFKMQVFIEIKKKM